MRIAKLIAGAGVLVAASLVGGTLIGSVLAAPRQAPATPTTAADETDGSQLAAGAGKYCNLFLDTFATKLGVQRDALLPAAKHAAKAAIDAAVADGKLDADRATALKERIDRADGSGCRLLHGPLRAYAHGFGRGFVHADVLDAAASALNLDSAQLFSRMAGGDSLKDVAADQGVDYATVKKDSMDALDADLKAAVGNGLSQDRADAVRNRVATWLDDGGEPPMHRLRDHLDQQPSSFSFR